MFEDKVFTSNKKVHENAITQNEKPQRAEKRCLWPAITRIFPVVSIQKPSPDVFYKKVAHNNFEKFTGKHLYRSLFLIKLQAKWYNDVKIGIYVVNLHLPWRKYIITICHIWLQHFTPRYVAKQIQTIISKPINKPINRSKHHV